MIFAAQGHKRKQKSVLVLTSTLCLVLGVLATACGKKEKELGKSGQASLAMANKTEQVNLADSLSPSVFGLKIVSVRLMVEQDNCYTTECPVIWLYPGCDFHESKKSSADGEKEFAYIAADTCADGVVDYFNLAEATEKVNAKLNSQELKVLPGTYNYVQINFSEGPLQSKALQFQAPPMATPLQSEIGGMWSIGSEKSAEPVVIGEGESVIIDLSYDLAGSVTTSKTGQNEYCYEKDDVIRCQQFPKFKLSFRRK